MVFNSKFAAVDRRLGQQGFTLVQTLIVVAIVGIVTTFGILGISSARAEIRLQNSARRFAVHIEKARLDSIRRHAATGAESEVETFDTTYVVRMDFDGTGGVQTQTFALDDGISFTTNAQTVTFDWRGRITEGVVFNLTNGSTTIPVDVSGSGDITLGSQFFPDNLIPDVALNPVPSDVVPDPTPFPTATPPANPPTDASPTPTPTPTPDGNGNGNGDGNGNGNGGNPNSTPTPTPTPIPTPTDTPTPDPDAPPAPCAAHATPSSLSLSQNASGQQSGTVSFTLSNATTGTYSVTAVQAGSGNNLTITVSPASISGNETAVVTISSKNGSGNRGNFTVNISASPSCGSVQQVTVSVGN